MKKAKERVKELLQKHPELRDSDNKLIAFYWYNELKGKGLDPTKLTAMEFLQTFADSKLTNSETIHSCRRKTQEVNKELRGKTYEVRQTKLQKQVKKELGYNG